MTDHPLVVDLGPVQAATLMQWGVVLEFIKQLCLEHDVSLGSAKLMVDLATFHFLCRTDDQLLTRAYVLPYALFSEASDPAVWQLPIQRAVEQLVAEAARC
jgi:hypothetical protein